MFFFFLFASADVASLEKFLNRHQDFAYKIRATITGKTQKIVHGVFYWHKDACKTACALLYDKEVGHRSLMVREGKRTYHYVTYDDLRNNTSKTNISNSPLHAFFAPVVRLKADERFTKTLTKVADGKYLLEIRHFTDTAKQKEHAKIYFKRVQEQWFFEKWLIVRADGTTEIVFECPTTLSPELQKKALMPSKSH